MHISGCDRCDAELGREITERDVAAHVATSEGALQLHEEARITERLRQPRCSIRLVDAEAVAGAPRKADQAAGVLLDERLAHRRSARLAILPARRAGACVCLGDDPAQVGVPLARFDEQGDMGAGVQGHLGTGDRPHAEALRGVREFERTVDAVVIGQGERRMAEVGGASGELFRERRAVEERVRRMAVEFDVRHLAVRTPGRRRSSHVSE